MWTWSGGLPWRTSLATFPHIQHVSNTHCCLSFARRDFTTHAHAHTYARSPLHHTQQNIYTTHNTRSWVEKLHNLTKAGPGQHRVTYTAIKRMHIFKYHVFQLVRHVFCLTCVRCAHWLAVWNRYTVCIYLKIPDVFWLFLSADISGAFVYAPPLTK